MKFSANISTMFKEFDVIDRIKEAKKCGFKAIEVQFPYGPDYDSFVETVKKEGIKLDLINTSPGDDDHFGHASIPGEEMQFLSDISNSLKITFPLGCTKLHILAGLRSPSFTEEEQYECFIRNLQSASEVLEEHDIIGLIEPICPEVKEDYFLNSFEKAIKIIEEVNKENIKLLLDVYHLHQIDGDVITKLPVYYPFAGHVQISQEPGRTEPFIEGGNIDYGAVLKFLKDHKDFIGLEYFPSKSTKDTLAWIEDYA